MTRQIEEIPLVKFNMDTESDVPLYKQLYCSLQKNILEGKLKPGQKLPGTRTLAGDLGVSRNTVATAFNQLLIEGYLRGQVGSGTYVNEIPEDLLQAKLISKQKGNSTERGNKNKSFINRLSTRKTQNIPIETIIRKSSGEEIIPFQMGIPALDNFPMKIWLTTINQVSKTLSTHKFAYGDTLGYRPLREAIADYLRIYRAVECSTDQIVIVSGSQQGLDLIGRILLPAQDTIWLEDPGYLGARISMYFSDAKIFPVPLDEEGLDLTYSVKNYPKPELIYTTPAHQFPLGITMSISRRLQLLQYAEENNCWIIEDDYDSEFRYSGNPLPSLQGMDRNGNVLYLGTFSKVLFPALRLGYLVLPSANMITDFAIAKYVTDRQCPIFEQIVLTKFIEDGHFTRHIRKMRMLYKERQDYLLIEIKKQLNGLVNAEPSPAGMHIILWLPESCNDKEIAKDATKNKVTVKALSEYSIKHKNKPGLILGYTAFSRKEIKNGVSRLKKVLANYL